MKGMKETLHPLNAGEQSNEGTSCSRKTTKGVTMRISSRFSRFSFIFVFALSLAALPLLVGEARAQSSYFTAQGCSGCHAAPAVATCNGCHAQATIQSVPNLAGQRATYIAAALDFLFGCHHGNLSRVFTIGGRSYRVCCDCGAEFKYSLSTMSIERRLRRTSVPTILRVA